MVSSKKVFEFLQCLFNVYFSSLTQVVVKPQAKKVTKAQQILAQVKKKKKLEEQKKVKKKEKEDTKKVKKKAVAENDNEKIDTVEVKLEKPAGPKKDSTPSKPKPAPRQFVLPTVSSRSSRKITPVRFFDEQFPSGGGLSNRSKVRIASDFTLLTKQRNAFGNRLLCDANMSSMLFVCTTFMVCLHCQTPLSIQIVYK